MGEVEEERMVAREGRRDNFSSFIPPIASLHHKNSCCQKEEEENNGEMGKSGARRR